MKVKKTVKIISVALAVCIIAQYTVHGYQITHASKEDADLETDASNYDFYYTEYTTYSEYLAELGEKADGTVEKSFVPDTLNSTYEGREAATVTENENLIIPVTVEEDGFYNLSVDYYPVQDGSSAIKFEVLIDGELPFYEAQNISLKRVWKDSTEKEYDSQGNQIRLPSEETPVWMNGTLKDASGFTQDPFRFYLTKGEHTITFSVYQNTLAVGQIALTQPETLATYEEVLSGYQEQGYQTADGTYRIEAEAASAKSDRSIVQVSDKTSPATLPYSGKEITYNSLGSGSWKTVGEWAEWEVEAPEDGLYTLVLRYKQADKQGDVSFRTLYIDGEIPFQEAASLAFSYDGSWQTEALGDASGAYQFYLTKGTHTIRMEATLGDYSGMIAKVNETLNDLNDIYTDIVMVTGPSPDTDRDYQFEKAIPEVLEQMQVVSADLKTLEKEIEQLTGQNGGQSTAVIKRLYKSLDEMLKDPETIAKRLNNYMSDITSLGTWINTSREQPLQLDYLMLSNADTEVPKDKSSLWEWIKYYVNQFAYSFKMDYANVGNKETETDKEITVWISSGRDQADIIRQLVNESFTPEYGIGVNVQLVDAGALMPATLADIGPDVYLGMAQNQPVEYALRHAVVDLSQFEDVGEVTKRFYDDSLTSFYLDGELYALPETMSYPMMFYRKDILTDLGIKEEDLKTWDDLLQKVLPELDMNNFDFGLLSNINSYGSILYQYGGTFYNETNTASAFDTSEAIAAFELMTSLYTDYGIPKSYDFANRFRSGQMPLAIADFTSYNQLSIFAPEIEGLWGMLPIPGIEKEDGTIDNTALCSVSGAVILDKSEYVEESWEFLKWWTDGETQSRYASELETVMGTGARYASANKEAMESVGWDQGIRNALLDQQEDLVGMPNIAGGYYTTRSFDFAFRDVAYNGENLRETLSNAATEITKEIVSKRGEFYDE